ncbi:MAG: hypothetical protein KKB31_06755 [Nanoarchaeota archaeon]|nr:hypothetical protein [Nanoarchaeota archaeon]
MILLKELLGRRVPLEVRVGLGHSDTYDTRFFHYITDGNTIIRRRKKFGGENSNATYYDIVTGKRLNFDP